MTVAILIVILLVIKVINKKNYEKYTNYYGIYKEDELDNILFATVTADNEDFTLNGIANLFSGIATYSE